MDEVRYTTVIGRDGNSFPAGGCRVILKSDGPGMYWYELGIIAPNGNEFTLEACGLLDRNVPDYKQKAFEADRDLINEAIKNGQTVLDLRDFPRQAE